MAHATRSRRSAPLTSLGLLLAAAGLASCVSQERYQEALDTSKLYQRMAHDLEQYQAELEAEVDALRAQLALRDDGGGGPIDASSRFESSIDERLAELAEMEERLAGISDQGEVSVVTFDGGYGYRLDDSVLFDSGSAEVRADGRRVLDELAREIRSRPYERVWVRGHTDADPIVKPETQDRFPHGNLQLSAARAVRVAAQLVAADVVDPGRVVVAGFGPNVPVASNDSAEGKQRNRRVEIYVVDADEAGGQ